ncbi:MAG: 16S rRNA (adenine(1518)-N(6)/adenine(1519)-N(6))-dimethyltransferase RsmA [Myxococcaceae bacterium]
MNGYIPKKSFGQNFLTDENHLHFIAQAACELRENKSTRVYEIGAGLGALTRALLKQGATVDAIERDRDLIPILRETFSAYLESKQLELHEANAVTFFTNYTKKIVICGNLPYHLTSSILFEIARLHDQISGAVFLIQKEVADRIASKPNSRVYGLLSVLMQSRFDTSVIHEVPSTAFWPPPKVESSVIRFKPRANPSNLNWALFVKLVKSAFAHRRKTLTNSLGDYPNIESILNSLQINPKSRAENLSFEDFEKILSCL